MQGEQVTFRLFGLAVARVFLATDVHELNDLAIALVCVVVEPEAVDRSMRLAVLLVLFQTNNVVALGDRTECM